MCCKVKGFDGSISRKYVFCFKCDNKTRGYIEILLHYSYMSYVLVKVIQIKCRPKL